MAELDFILQAVTKATHAKAVRELIQLPDAKRILVSVSFVREAGVTAIEDAIKPLANRVGFFVGIRNDITSIQAVKRLLSLKVSLYAVDTGSRHIIFHPKLYLALSDTEGRGIVGSANVTFSGLHNNIEVSTVARLDLANAADKKFADDVTTAFLDLVKNHPSHVFEIKDEKHAEELFESGRLTDETIIRAPTVAGTIKKGHSDKLEQMKLSFTSPPKTTTTTVTTKTTSVPVASGGSSVAVLVGAMPGKPAPTAAPPPSNVPYLVWRGKPLSRRALTIPTGTNTHPTGSMGWTKGVFEIDQRHYFREEVFKDLTWTVDAKSSTSEHAFGKFELIIKNVNYGVFELKLAHSNDTTSETYRQSNFVTQVHWGSARPYIARPDLLGRTLSLYRKDSTPPEFVIEID